MRKFQIYLIVVFAFATLISGCRKSDTNLDVDMSDYPQNVTPTNDIDTWLTQNFTNPYNIQVVYRFNRGNQDADERNVSPVSIDKIKPSMQTILDVFIEPYMKVGGDTFCKTYFHKQWVLFGSPSYNSDNTFTVGTSSNARTMVLYDLNRYDITNPNEVQWRSHVVFHEFTHALNQTIPIPPAYEAVGSADYQPTWAGVDTATANSKGQITPYAGTSYTEDFAEQLAFIVVEGPIKYSNILNKLGASSTGYTRLKQKEAIIYQYMLNNYHVDIYDLQAEVQKQLKTVYHLQDPIDITTSFPFQLAGNKVNTITIDPTAVHYTTYGSSAAFNTVLNNYRNSVTAAGRSVTNLQFIFTSATSVTLRINYTNPSTGGSLQADYSFNFTVNTSTGAVQFTKVLPEGTTTANGNGQSTAMLPSFENYLLPYLTNRQFIAAYLPTTITSANPLYKTFAGFYVNGTSTNYFYGPVTYK